MKIRDLPSDKSLEGVRFIYPGDGEKYYWRSQWNKGVWATKELGDTRMYPLQVEELQEVLEWEIVE